MMFYEWIFPENFLMKILWESPNFSLIFCQVYHTMGFLGVEYECACWAEAILGTFGRKKLESFFPSLIMGVIMGGVQIFSNFVFSSFVGHV